MAGIFSSPPAIVAPQAPPVAPTLSDETVQAATQAELSNVRKGRASTILTDPQTQRPSYLTGD